jgi:hypothetical protein
MSEELHRAVGRVEGKIDGIVEMLARHEGFDKRVAAVERKQAWYSGAAAAVGVIAAYVFKH